jgi:hypothetical protein
VHGRVAAAGGVESLLHVFVFVKIDIFCKLLFPFFVINHLDLIYGSSLIEVVIS